MKTGRSLSIFILLCMSAFSTIYAQTLKSMDFRNQSITDILLVLAEVSGTSIIPDETVSGSASFHFTDSNFEDSLALFLSTYKFSYVRNGNVFKVSRISTDFDEKLNLVTMKADTVDIENLIRSLSRTINTTILYDPLPKTTVSVNIEKLPPLMVLEILTKRIPEYVVEKKDSYYFIKHVVSNQRTPGGAAEVALKRVGETYTLSLEKGRFLELLADLFKKAGKEYSLLNKTDIQLDNLYFANQDFEGLLRLILEQGNADYIVQNGIYYILEMQKRDIVKKLKETTALPLTYISAQDLPNMLPAELASGNIIKIDKNSNTIFLTGSAEEIKPITDFIALVDRSLDGLQYERFEIKFLKVKDILAVIPPKMVPIAPVVIPESNSFIVLGSAEGLTVLRDFIGIVDRKKEGYPVRLQYIKTEELIKSIPPSISKEDIVDSGYPNLFFFTGSEEKRQLFLRELLSIDRPKPQIRYQLLVIQYTKNKELKTSRGLIVDSSPESDKTAFLGTLTNILSLSFDVVAQFGYQFAAKLSMQMGENLAQVYADTTLNGLSGQEIKFQNTDTSRYQEREIDEVTKKEKSTGVIKEISSGLIVTLNGWVSGNDMVTMNVNATVSKQNLNNSTATTTLPSTSERVVNTQVRTPSGKPIVISGLIKEDTNKNVQKIPFLGSIPLLGLLFRDEVETKEKTEIVIYIVPHLTRENEDEQGMPIQLERYYRTFIQGYSK